MRAAVSSQREYPACSAAARPPRSRSSRRCSSSEAPAETRSARCSARLRAASVSAGAAGAAFFLAVRSARPASQVRAQSGAPSLSPDATGPSGSLQRRSSPSACLHGNFRLGQLHWYAGPVVSTTVR